MTLTLILLAMIGIFFLSDERRKQAFADFAGGNPLLNIEAAQEKYIFQMAATSCVGLADDVGDPTNCPTITPGASGTFKIIEWSCIDDFGTMNATTGTWDTDFVLTAGASWFTHSTDDDFAKIDWQPLEGGNFESTVTLFYKGYSAARRNFFEKAHSTGTYFAVAFTTNDGTTHILEKCKISPAFDSKLVTETTAAGFNVTLKMKGISPYPYTGALV